MADRKTSLYTSNRSNIWKVECASKPVFVSKEFTASSADSSREIGFHENLKAIPGVVGYLGCCYGEYPKLVMEFCEHGSLKHFLKSLREPVPEDRLLFWYQSMAKTMRLMHAARVVHRVISAENWLVTGDYQVKLTDFGHATKMEVIHGEPTKSTSLRDETGESTGLRTKQIFADDALRLARVFYQMASFDLATPVMNLQQNILETMCRQRGYSDQISKIICHLLQLRNKSVNRQVEVGEILQRLELGQPLPDVSFDILDIENLSNLCSLCKDDAEEMYPFPCEHWICEACKKRLSSRRTELICELCANTVTSSEAPRVVEGRLDFSLIDFSSLG